MRLPGIRKLLLGSAIAIALFALSGFFALPPLVKSIAQTQAGKALGREVQIDALSINPFALSATVKGFRLYEKDSREVFASVDELYANVELSSVLHLAPVLSALRVSAPKVKIVRLTGQRFNFSDILETLAKQPKSDKKALFSLNNIELTDGRIDIDDRPEDARHAVTDIRLAVPFASNLPAQVDVKITPAFAAKFNDTAIELKGETVPFKETLESSLTLSLADLQLGRYLRYVPVTLGFELPTGALSADLRISFIRAKDQPQRLTVSGVTRLRDLSVVDASKAKLIALALLEVDLESLDVFGRSVDVSKILVEGLAIDAVREKDGRINLLSLLPTAKATTTATTTTTATATATATGGEAAPTALADPAASAAPGTPAVSAAPGASAVPAAKPAAAPVPFRFSIAEFAFNDGKVTFTDRVPTPAFRADATDIDIGVKGLSNAKDSVAQVTAAIRTALGESINASSTLVLEPVLAEGNIEVAGLRPRNYAAYYTPIIALQIDDAKVDASTAFRVAANAGKFDSSVTGLVATVTDLRLRRTGARESLLEVKTIRVAGVDVDLARRIAHIGEFSTRDGLAFIEREKDGQFNFSQLLLRRPEDGSVAAGAPGEPWQWAIKRLELERWTVRFADRLPQDPVAIELSGIAATAAGLDSSKGSRAKVSLKLAYNRTGTLAASGQVGIDPAVAAIDLDARALPLVPLQPYFGGRLNVVLTGGEVSAKGTVNADTSVTPMRAGYKGEVNFGNFSTLERTSNEELVRFKSFFFGGVDVTTVPMQVTIGEISLSDFATRLTLTQDGRLTIRELVKGDPAATAGSSKDKPAGATAQPPPDPAAATAAAPTPRSTAAPGAAPAASPLPFPLRIGRISVVDGTVNYSDFFVRPNYRVNLTGLTGSVSSLSSEPGTTAELQLRAAVDGTAPVEIAGRLNPITNPLFLDIKASMRGAELSTLSPYTIKYTGYGIERGRLTLTTSYRIEGRKLEAQHRVFLDQLTFSTDRVDGPAVIKLPILFAVRLLQNRRGEIDLALPISGTLDDPKFRLGPIIWQVVVNLITRVVTAPFSIFSGGSSEELSFVEFEPGRAVLTEAAQKKLTTLGKGLTERPALRLELSAGVDAATDREAVRRVQLEAAVRLQKARELVRKGESVPEVDALALDPKEYETYLRAVYRDAKFPKPRNAIGLLRDLPVPEMETLIITNTQVTDDDLRELALARSRAVERFLEKAAGLSSERVFLVTQKPGTAGEKAKASAARVDMTIR